MQIRNNEINQRATKPKDIRGITKRLRITSEGSSSRNRALEVGMVDARLALLRTVAKKKKKGGARGSSRSQTKTKPSFFLKMIYYNILNAKYDVIRDGFHLMLLCSGETSITKVRLEGTGCMGSS